MSQPVFMDVKYNTLLSFCNGSICALSENPLTLIALIATLILSEIFDQVWIYSILSILSWTTLLTSNTLHTPYPLGAINIIILIWTSAAHPSNYTLVFYTALTSAKLIRLKIQQHSILNSLLPLSILAIGFLVHPTNIITRCIFFTLFIFPWGISSFLYFILPNYITWAITLTSIVLFLTYSTIPSTQTSMVQDDITIDPRQVGALLQSSDADPMDSMDSNYSV